MSVVQELEVLVSEGPATLLFQAEEALSIDAAIGSAADAVNKSKFKNCFVAFQAYAIEQFVLAVTKLYEQPGSKYELRSVPAIIAYSERHAADLPIDQPHLFEQHLSRLRLWSSQFDDMHVESRTREAMARLKTTIPQYEENAAYSALKALRDKRIAHPEAIASEEIPKTTWEEAGKLLAPAKNIVMFLGDVYLRTAYGDNEGNFYGTFDAQAAGVCTRRVLRELNLLAPL